MRVIISLLLLFLMACQEDPTAVQLRVHNDSPFVLDVVSLQNDAADPLTFTNIAAGAYSAYRDTPYSYSFAGIQTSIGNDTLRLLPIDYTGAQRYEEGRFTFRLIISGEKEPEGLVVEFVPE